MTNDIALVLLGEVHTLQYTDEEPKISRLTGRQLQVIRLELVVGDSVRDHLHDEIMASRDRGKEIKSTDGRLWVADGPYSIGDRGDHHVFDLQLTERETITIERVEYDGLVLVPDRWAVDAGADGGFAVLLLVTAQGEQHEAIERAITEEPEPSDDFYRPVRIVGLREDVIPMRFGQCVWQPIENGARHRLVLVSKEGDDITPKARLADPELGATMTELNTNTIKLDALINELRSLGVLTDEAVQRIEAATEVRPPGLWRRYMATDNIERHWSERQYDAAG